ncbi:hypothetical protein E6O75_ATG06508 [Venturia nashicola]|uniref:Uncharacterized protein n=1 Tax=Venturia nashicola TaxID=86259 RepID=A0A4Z1NV32_9PEZI|nr:hypothetical protein E6O75_ATG06508 [Venturia nashicola]
MTSYGISGGARVFSAALNDLNDGETGMLKDAIGKPLPSSPAEEGTVKVLSETPTREIATGFDAHHDSMLWSDEPEEHCSCQIQSKASRGSCHFAAKTVAPLMEEPIIKAPMGTRNLSGATIVPSVEGQPQLVNDEPIMLVRHGVPAWFSKEQEHCEKDSEAHVVRKYTVEAQVQPTSHSVLPCEGTESCASRVVRLEQQNERLTKEVEQLRQETNHLRMFAVGVSCLLIGGALVLARLRRS